MKQYRIGSNRPCIIDLAPKNCRVKHMKAERDYERGIKAHKTATKELAIRKVSASDYFHDKETAKEKEEIYTVVRGPEVMGDGVYGTLPLRSIVCVEIDSRRSCGPIEVLRKEMHQKHEADSVGADAIQGGNSLGCRSSAIGCDSAAQSAESLRQPVAAQRTGQVVPRGFRAD